MNVLFNKNVTTVYHDVNKQSVCAFFVQLPELLGKRVLGGIANCFPLLFYELFFNVLFQLQQKSEFLDFWSRWREQKRIVCIASNFFEGAVRHTYFISPSLQMN